MKHMVETMKLEEGKVTMNGVPFIFTLTKSIYYTQKELEKVLGEEWKKICYGCGKVDGIAALAHYFAMFRDNPDVQKLFADKVESFKFCVHEFNRMGKGRLEIITADGVKPHFRIQMYFSPVAQAYLEHEKSTEPVCYHFAGIWSGAASVLYPSIEAVETKCLAKGDPYCEFAIEIPMK